MRDPTEPQSADMSERDWETYALDLLAERGWRYVPGPELGPAHGVRKGWGDLVLYPQLRKAIVSRYPELPSHTVEEAISELLEQKTQKPIRENHRFYQKLIGGVKVSYTSAVGGEERHITVRPVDFANPHGNDLMAASQVRVHSIKDRTFIFDIVLYVNGLPLALFELKKASSTDDSRSAYDQLRGYGRELERTGTFAHILTIVASDGITARLGTPFTAWQHMAPWHVEEDGTPVSKEQRLDGRALERMIDGAFEPDRFLDLIAHFMSYSAEGTGSVDTVKLAKAHQYIAVNQAVLATEAAVATDGRAGVVWHTQGAGKSEEMLFYVGKVARTPELSNPTIVLLTDRIDLDSQLYKTFARSRSLHQAVGGEPAKVQDTAQLRDLLTRQKSGGGVIFTTLQKFRLRKNERETGDRHPLLSPRRDIIVVVDEAHRSHYGFIDGFARNLRDALPHAAFIAFTGTPIDNKTGSTRAVFGADIHTYDLTQAVDDGATVPVFYEPHLVRVDLPEDVDLDELDAQAEGLVEDLSEDEQRRARRRFATYESLIGAPRRVEELAAHILAHWDVRRTEMIKLTGRAGKAMVVCSSRAIAARLFEAMARQRPAWIGERDKTGQLLDGTGKIKVVYTGNPAKDTVEIAEYVRTPAQLKKIQERVIAPENELEIVIVQSLWLTGFDAPPLHTLYLDRRMRGAALMQAIARVNRTWDEKPSGLVVDFLGVAERITEALAEYSPTDQEKRTIGADISAAVDMVREHHQRLVEVLHGCEWRSILNAGGKQSYRKAVEEALEFLAMPEPRLPAGKPTRKSRFMHFSRLLAQAFSLCPTSDDLKGLLSDIRFFEVVRTSREKLTADQRAEQGLVTEADLRLLIEQLNASAVAADGVVDIYDAAKLTKPDLSHLDENFVRKLQASRHPNLAIEALRRAMMKEIREAHPTNITRQQVFTDKMKTVMNRYTNGLLTSAQVMELLVELAQEISADRERAKMLGLTEDELAFYDAVAANPSAVEELGTDILAKIARELVRQVRQDVTIDWKVREQARDRIKAKVKRLLRFYGYPPDRQPEAIELVLRQTEAKAEEWA